MAPTLVSMLPILMLLSAWQVLSVASDLPVKRVLLIHGAAFGSISWYRIIPALEQKGLQVTAVDSLSLGRDTTPTCNVTSIQKWAANAVSYAEGLAPGEKFIAVGHSAGGLVLQYLCENFPEKIAAAVFIASLAPPNNESAEIALSKFERPPPPPGSLIFTQCDYSVSNALWRDNCQDCSDEDITLIEYMVRPQPSNVFGDLTRVTAARFGSARRFWVKTLRDQTVLPSLQDYFISNMKPVKVIEMDTDHVPMFTAVRKLKRVLLRIIRQVA